MTEGRPAPGETRPRTLARPPGDRYAGATTGGSGGLPLGRERRVATRPNLVRAALFGLLAAIGIGGLFATFVGILDLDVGLLALAAIGGWGIGAATRIGAWPKVIALPARSVRRLAVAFGVTAWLGGYFGAYLLSLLLRPNSSLTFGQRLAQSPFLDWLSPQFGVRQVIEILLLCGIAWYSSGARSGSGSGSSE